MKPFLTLRNLWMTLGLFFTCAASAQVTTATLNGIAKTAGGENLAGATIVAEHTPSGTRYGTTTNADGRYVIPNLRVGGPYRVTTSATGFEPQNVDGIFLSLGQKLSLDFNLRESAQTLGEVVISGNRDDVMNAQRTGAALNIRTEQIATLPTINRSAADYYRLSPASDGNSFAGRNDQYNNFSLDGTIFNNPFGLDAATPGGQAEAQPVSLDAIDQIQVAYAPYDVTQSGFTGAAINAVTKSGTNQFKGTVFGFYRNQSLIGSKVDSVEAPKGDLTQFQAGFSLGGPIIRNKLFFFVNAEMEERSDLGSSFLAERGVVGAGISRVSASDLERVSAVLKQRFNYETGPYENFTLEAPNKKAIAKLDWNISTDHKLTLIYNWLDASKEKPAHPSAIGRRGPDFTTLQFRNSGYRINNKLNSGLAELKSVFGARVSNKFQIGYSSFRDSRDPFSSAFPVININKDGVRYIVAGHEPFSIYNRLNQDVFQLNDQVNVFLGNHTLTIGGAFERFNFDNSFNLNAYNGTFGPGYESVDAFVAAVEAGQLDRDVFVADSLFTNRGDQDWNWSYTNLGQISAYIQDEIAVGENLTVTAGIRLDRPEYFNTKALIEEKLTRSCCYVPDVEYYDENGQPIRFDHTVLPKEKIMFNPRLGFNWDIKGDQSRQLRGGTGLFTGRFPFVWIGNHVANPDFFFYNVTRPDFLFPQVWRSNLGYDHKFGAGWVASLDVLYTKDINGMMVRNYGLRLPGGTLQAPGDNRPIYRPEDRAQVFGGPTNAYVFTNTDVGYSTNIMLQVQRTFSDGLYASLGYNYLDSKDASSIEAEISSDAYDRNPAYGHVNDAVLAPSLYGNRHRVVGAASKKFTYGKLGTTIGVFFQYAQGGRFSYTYSGDINNDGSGLNDLMYVPTDAQIDQMQFSGNAGEQRDALKKFIAQDEYLSGHRGEVVEKYGLLSPWYNNWDVRILQDFGFAVGERTHNVQVSFDILNVGNLINDSWSIRRIPTTTQPLGVSVDAAGVPTYSFDTNITDTFVQDFSLLSRWQMQVGLRYSF